MRSLHEVGGLANPPWPRTVMEKPALLGVESLIGYAITHAQNCVINSRDEVTFFPVQWIEYERSTAAFPIYRHGRIVGGLIVSSTLEYFFTPPHLEVIESYAHLATCIFESDKSFDLHEIDLRMMPPYTRQRPYFAGYNQRVSRKLAQANALGQPITFQDARQLVWQDLEEVLLQIDLQAEVESLS